MEDSDDDIIDRSRRRNSKRGAPVQVPSSATASTADEGTSQTTTGQPAQSTIIQGTTPSTKVKPTMTKQKCTACNQTWDKVSYNKNHVIAKSHKKAMIRNGLSDADVLTTVEVDYPFFCEPCWKGFTHPNYWTEHIEWQIHKANVSAASKGNRTISSTTPSHSLRRSHCKKNVPDDGKNTADLVLDPYREIVVSDNLDKMKAAQLGHQNMYGTLQMPNGHLFLDHLKDKKQRTLYSVQLSPDGDSAKGYARFRIQTWHPRNARKSRDQSIDIVVPMRELIPEAVKDIESTLVDMLQRLPLPLWELDESTRSWVIQATVDSVCSTKEQAGPRYQCPSFSRKSTAVAGRSTRRASGKLQLLKPCFTVTVDGCDQNKLKAWTVTKDIFFDDVNLETSAHLTQDQEKQFDKDKQRASVVDSPVSKYDKVMQVAKLTKLTFNGSIGTKQDCKKAMDDFCTAFSEPDVWPGTLAKGGILAQLWQSSSTYRTLKRGGTLLLLARDPATQRVRGKLPNISAKGIGKSRAYHIMSGMLILWLQDYDILRTWEYGAAQADAALYAVKRQEEPESDAIESCATIAHQSTVHVCPECTNIRRCAEFEIVSEFDYKVCRTCIERIAQEAFFATGEEVAKQHLAKLRTTRGRKLDMDRADFIREQGLLAKAIVSNVNHDLRVAGIDLGKDDWKRVVGEIIQSTKPLALGDGKYHDIMVDQVLDYQQPKDRCWDGSLWNYRLPSVEAVYPLFRYRGWQACLPRC